MRHETVTGRGEPLPEHHSALSTQHSLLRLIQVTDSSFPTGGYAFSHGMEWLVSAGAVRGEVEVGDVLAAYVAQCGGGQAFSVALGALRARTLAAVLRCDERLDASMAAPAERDAGRAMGERLLSGASEAFGGERTAALLAAVLYGRTPGQYAVAFGAVCRDQGVPPPDLLGALGFVMASSVVQAAVRLNVIGQAAAARLIAGAAPLIEREAAHVLAARRPSMPGAFVPGLDVAGLLQPTLSFRMFAS